jgi:hypothetical protein
MDARELFMLRYDAIHDGLVGELFTGLGDEQVRRRPHGVNSIVWLVWHMARIEDAVLSRLVADRPQVLEEGGWNARMGLRRRDVGSGMSGDEVEALSAAIDVAALRGYQRAVADRTKGIVAALPAAAWEEPVAPEHVRREVADGGLLVDAGRWVGDFWAEGRLRGWYLLQVGLLHPYGHCFDGAVTRGLLGVAER